MATHDPKTYFLYTSLAAGSSKIYADTNQLEGLLKAHQVPFEWIDIGTDERAKSIWKRRGIAAGKKLPAVVKDELILGVCISRAPSSPLCVFYFPKRGG